MMEFENINKGYNEIFKPKELSIGVVVPIEHYVKSPVPTMKDHLYLAKLVEELGFKALWVRDVPLNVPTFGDAEKPMVNFGLRLIREPISFMI